jgi:4'-phosphopantetheinyl transferase
MKGPSRGGATGNGFYFTLPGPPPSNRIARFVEFVDPAPPADSAPTRFGPVVVRAWPYRRGEPAEPRVQAWLGEALGLPPARLRFGRDLYGRPHPVSIDGDQAVKDAEIDVNWSHSGDWLIAACARGARVGIDLELLRPRPKALGLAQRFFAPEETAALAALADAPETLQQRFTRLWCAKEAVLKAHGRGLSFGLHRLRFDLGEDDRLPHMRDCDPALGAPEDWRLHAWAPRPGYWATLAFKPIA